MDEELIEDQLNHILIIEWFVEFIDIKRVTSIGNDAVTVYIIKYILA